MSSEKDLHHPCEDLKEIDEIVKQLFNSSEFKEEFCINIDLNNIINKKKYFIFNLSQILDKRKLYKLITKCISHFKYHHLKEEISEYLTDTCGFGLDEKISLEKAEMFFAINDISNFIIKYDKNKCFNIYISEKVPSFSLKDYKTLSIKDNKIKKKTYNLLNQGAIKSSIDSIVKNRDVYALSDKDGIDFSVQEKSELNNEAVFIPKSQEFISPKFKTSYVSYESDQSIGIYYRHKEIEKEFLEDIFTRWRQSSTKDSSNPLFWECFFSFALDNSTKKLYKLRKLKFNLETVCLYIYILRKRNKLKLLSRLYLRYGLLKFFSFGFYNTSFIDAQRFLDKKNVYKYMDLLYSKKNSINKVCVKNLFSLSLLDENHYHTKHTIDFLRKNIAIKLDKNTAVNIRNMNYLTYIIETHKDNNFYIYSDQYQFDFFKKVLNYRNATVVNSLKNIKVDQIVSITSLYLNIKDLQSLIDSKKFDIHTNTKGTRKIGVNLLKNSKFISSLTNTNTDFGYFKDIISLYNNTSVIFFDLSGREDKNLFGLPPMPKSLSLLEKCHYLQHLNGIITFDNEDLDLYNFLNIKTYIISETEDSIKWNKHIFKNSPNLKFIKNLDQETISTILDDLVLRK